VSSPIVRELNSELEQWIACPVCLEIDVGWDGLCGCGREMIRVYSEDGIERAATRLENAHAA
jgi:hypothetical protein